MMPKCPRYIRPDPRFPHAENPKRRRIVRKGSTWRKSDRRQVRKFQCRECGLNFSSATLKDEYRQKKRRLNPKVEELLCAKVDVRRIAIILRINRKTVDRKRAFLAKLSERAELAKRQMRERGDLPKLAEIQFDDLETFEHSKCKPLSVSLAVDPKTYEILGFEVSIMPAKHPLSLISRLKYGERPDGRPAGLARLMEKLVSSASPYATFTSDRSPLYPVALRKHFPNATHIRKKSRRAHVAGQGEMKKIGFDPLFAINHACATLRANINRLVRRTWSTTKKIEKLIEHIHVFIAYYHRVLLPRATAGRPV